MTIELTDKEILEMIVNHLKTVNGLIVRRAETETSDHDPRQFSVQVPCRFVVVLDHTFKGNQ